MHYSRAEKRGMAILVLLILFFLVLPGIWSLLKSPPVVQLNISSDKIAADSIAVVHEGQVTNFGYSGLHTFDPNAASESELQGLGFPSYLAKRLLRYREKGGAFRTAEDLKRLWGMHHELYERLLPYIHIPISTEGEIQYPERIQPPHDAGRPQGHQALDVNRADSALLLRLAGIGPKLAARIVAFREKLGGYYRLEQLSEVYGMNQETLDQLKRTGAWNIGSGVYRKIQVNTFEAAALRHPYLSRVQAKALEAYRRQHGAFLDSSSIRRVLSFSPGEIDRLLPYLDYAL